MARTQRKYSHSRTRNSTHREEKRMNAINFDCEIDEQVTGYKISGKKRWNKQISPDFDYNEF